MKYDTVIYEKQTNVARVTLNRPEKLNVFPFVGMGGLADDFLAALDEAEEDDEVKVVIIKGAGRAFSAGRDLETVGFVYGMGTGKPGERRPSQRIRLQKDRPTFGEFFRRVFLFPKVTIAQVHGYAYGAGAELMNCCDIAIAARNAKIGHPEQRLGGAGLDMDMGISIMNIGLKRTMELYLTSLPINGKQAERIGLVNKAVPEEKLEREVNRMAEVICLLSRDSIAMGKAARHLLYDSLGLTNSFTLGYIMHSFMTNVRWEPDEYNFFKERRQRGATAAIRGRDARYAPFEQQQ